ncbi:lipase family protein [Branchiibius cervicis]|uniref:Lipase family protein n=1 Tax=Branchiibius cervicis TaxID=908252 RepID=A0ABW2AVL6_9MICO
MLRTVSTAAAAAVLAAGGLTALAPNASAASFYDPPPSIPSAPGTVIDSQQVSTNYAATATKIMYSSIDSNGQPVAVTGMYLQPRVAWKGSGSRPLVSYAFGTIGQGDQCAPSKLLQNPIGISGNGNGGITTALGYDAIFVGDLLNRGYSVVVTDYVGLGTTDRVHTYMNRLDQGHAVLDAVRAARNLPGTDITTSSRVATWGYSQGGGATGSAAELQPSYAPDVPLAGSFVGAPPADLGVVIKGIEGNAIAGVLGYAINGLARSYPALQPILDANTNDAGKAVLKSLSTQCIADTVLSYGGAKSTQWITGGRSLSDVIAANPVAQQIVDSQRIGRLRPASPVLLTTDLADQTVPHSQVRQLAVDWCAKGARVNYTTYGLNVQDGDKLALHHVAGMVESWQPALNWVSARLAGVPEYGNCLFLPLLK